MNRYNSEQEVHTSVLLQEIVNILDPKPGQSFVDGTANGGGHTFALAEKIAPNGKILAIDKDSVLIERLQNHPLFSSSVIAVCDSYANIERIAQEHGFGSVAGIVLDLGYSSYHLAQSGRGFSFQKDEPLVMRYETDSDLGSGLTAREVVNSFPENELADIIYKYGEDRLSRRIAKAICLARKKQPIETSGQLAEIVASAYPRRAYWKIQPATKTFQALRIFVNEELADLERVLPQAVRLLASGGKLAIISFHSLEDKIVKEFYRAQAKEGAVSIITKKPITSGAEELKANPRARSAKLRVCIKL